MPRTKKVVIRKHTIHIEEDYPDVCHEDCGGLGFRYKAYSQGKIFTCYNYGAKRLVTTTITNDSYYEVQAAKRCTKCLADFPVPPEKKRKKGA